MLSELGGWKFDENVAPIFDKHVRQSVPMYEEIHKMIGNMSVWFVEDRTRVYDLGTSTGEVIDSVLALNEDKQVEYIGYDNSIEMIERAKQRFKDRKSVSVECLDVSNIERVYSNSSFITSVLTLQFIPQKDRQGLVDRVYSGLNQGGGFVLVEKIVPESSRIGTMWTEMYHDMKLENNLSYKEVVEKSRSIRGVLKPNTVSENLSLLTNAGFTDMDIFFKWNNFVGIVAIK